MNQQVKAESSYLGTNLRCLRKRFGWTQDDAAKRLHVKRGRFGAWEEGRAFPPIPIFMRMLQVFRTTAYELYYKDLRVEIKVVDVKEKTFTVSEIKEALLPVIGDGAALSSVLINLGV